jgi:hypothetical protein
MLESKLDYNPVKNPARPTIMGQGNLVRVEAAIIEDLTRTR